MKMPNNELALVAKEKITAYLLSDTHPIGKDKAAFFKRFGFDLSEVEQFESALTKHANEREVEKTIENDFGVKYELKCELQTPDERNPCNRLSCKMNMSEE
jgi:hypothetical protein